LDPREPGQTGNHEHAGPDGTSHHERHRTPGPEAQLGALARPTTRGRRGPGRRLGGPGSQVLASADDTTPVWSVSTDVVAGTPLSGDAVEVDRVRLDDGADAALYLSGDDPFPTGMVAAHDLAAGELVSRSDVRAPGERSGAELPVAVQDGHRPTDLAAGDVVDVWVAPGPASQSSQPARQVLTAVDVIAVDATGGGIGGGSAAVVLLGLAQPDSADLPDTLSAITSGTVVLVRVRARSDPGPPGRLRRALGGRCRSRPEPSRIAVDAGPPLHGRHRRRGDGRQRPGGGGAGRQGAARARLRRGGAAAGRRRLCPSEWSTTPTARTRRRSGPWASRRCWCGPGSRTCRR
jgi:hypothetical protein